MPPHGSIMIPTLEALLLRLKMRAGGLNLIETDRDLRNLTTGSRTPSTGVDTGKRTKLNGM